MKASPEKQFDLRQYRTYGMPLLVLLGILAAVGIIAAIIISYFF